MESIQKIVTENPDSIETGSAAKGSKIKVYGNFSDIKAFKEKIDNSKAVKEYLDKIINPIM